MLARRERQLGLFGDAVTERADRADRADLAQVEALQRRITELEQLNRDLGAFAADVAHDMRAPLQAIFGFSELLIRREGARLDETSQEYLAHVLGGATTLRDLVDAVLEHRRSSSVELHIERVPCQELIDAVLARLQSEIVASDADIVVDDLPEVPADRLQLSRVFQNLIANAIRAAAPGRPLRIRVSARRLGPVVEFSVTDNGVGVTADDVRRIFEPFQRGAGSDPRSGVGMGLTICRAIVERLGGRIAVSRVHGGGSRFSFTLPVDT